MSDEKSAISEMIVERIECSENFGNDSDGIQVFGESKE